MQSELGKTSIHTFDLYNPSNELIETEAILTNTINFSIVPEQIVLKPKETTKIDIVYSPTIIERIESAELKITTEEIGDWKLFLQGTGIMPTPFDPVNIKCPITTDL